MNSWMFDCYHDIEPKCLYCHNKCDLYSKTENNFTQTASLFCRFCKESYRVQEFHSMGPLEYTIYITCNDIILGITENKEIVIYRGDSSVVIPEFELDLSDKDKLFEKLKIYFNFA